MMIGKWFVPEHKKLTKIFNRWKPSMNKTKINNITVKKLTSRCIMALHHKEKKWTKWMRKSKNNMIKKWKALNSNK